MGQYFIAVNLDKRQILNDIFGNVKTQGRAWRFGEIFTASLALLTYRSFILESDNVPHVGYWQGDRVIITGDYEPVEEGIVEEALEQGSNLYNFASDNYDDFSYQAMSAVFQADERLLQEYVEETDMNNVYTLLRNGYLATTCGCRALESLLEDRFGKGWIKRYSEEAARTSELWRFDGTPPG